MPCLNFQSGDEPAKFHENPINHCVIKWSSCEEPFNLSVSSQRSTEPYCHPVSNIHVYSQVASEVNAGVQTRVVCHVVELCLGFTSCRSSHLTRVG